MEVTQWKQIKETKVLCLQDRSINILEEPFRGHYNGAWTLCNPTDPRQAFGARQWSIHLFCNTLRINNVLLGSLYNICSFGHN